MSNCGTCPSKGSCNKEEKSCGIEMNPQNKIKNVIGVMSGKGGVGKSSISVLIAKRLAKLGYKVGILDADITGPSIPRLLHLENERALSNGQNILPVISKEGIKVMSLNFLVEEETKPVVWRGPVITGAIKQFWNEVLWEELDYLLIDMPPGTGDVPLTIMQTLPVTGMVVVSVPQDFISMIVAKSINMIKMLNIPVLGLVENMSYITCPDCDKKIMLFEGNETGAFLDKVDVPLLGELPMKKSISSLSVKGTELEDEIDQLMSPIVEKLLNNISK